MTRHVEHSRKTSTAAMGRPLPPSGGAGERGRAGGVRREGDWPSASLPTNGSVAIARASGSSSGGGRDITGGVGGGARSSGSGGGGGGSG